MQEFNPWLRGHLRRVFYRSHNRYHAIKAARIAKGQYRCAVCNKVFQFKEIKIDHLNPVIDPAMGFVDWNTFIMRLFCAAHELQPLCGGCHKLKTVKENADRALHGTGVTSEASRLKMARPRKKRTK